MHAHEMISTHPHVKGSTNDTLIRCIEECYSYAQVCASCADDCADVCVATGSVATRRTGSNEDVIRRILEASAAASVPSPAGAASRPARLLLVV